MELVDDRETGINEGNGGEFREERERERDHRWLTSSGRRVTYLRGECIARDLEDGKFADETPVRAVAVLVLLDFLVLVVPEHNTGKGWSTQARTRHQPNATDLRPNDRRDDSRFMPADRSMLLFNGRIF